MMMVARDQENRSAREPRERLRVNRQVWEAGCELSAHAPENGKCLTRICHDLRGTGSRRAGPSLAGLFGRRAGTLAGYPYSDILDGSDIVWNDNTIDQLFDIGPDHYIPGSKMPMQRITNPQDRADLIGFLHRATAPE